MDQPGVFFDLDTAGNAVDDPVVTIGNFDGVHIGHREIFERAIDRADDAGVASLALTFTPHPVRFFRPDADAFRLTTDSQKFDLIKETGVDAVFALRFDQNIASLSPEAFVEQLLDQGLSASRVIVGANFAFGKNRAGSTDDLERLCDEHGIVTDICRKVRYGGEVVSSTRIRGCLEEGKVGEAAELLGRRHRVVGRVIEGDKRGRELGYPTANLQTENLVPADGIYATYLHVQGEDSYPAATSIGTRPVFDGDERTTEAYVLDRDNLDLYESTVELEFVEYIRDERDFSDSAALVEQMERDVEQTRKILQI